MTRIAGCALAGALIAVTAPGPVAGQADAYLVDVWTTDHGLPQNSVNEIVQTSDGYLWLGTFGGLVRFDGVRFTLVPRVDSAGSHLDRVVDVVLAAGDTIWLATESGLLRHAGGRFRHWGIEDGVPAREVRALALGEKGAIWLQTAVGFARFRDGRLETLADTAGGIGQGSDAEGRLWREKGDPTHLIYREREDGMVEKVPRWSAPSTLALETSDGASWHLRTFSGDVTRHDGVERGWTREHGIFRPNHLVRDPRGLVWIGNEGPGIQLLDPSAPSGATVTTIPGAHVSAAVHAMYVDREGTLWVGTNGDGLMRIKRKLVDAVAADRVVTAILQHSDGRMLLGTNCAGLHVLEPGASDVVPFLWPPGRQLGCPTALAEGPDGALWVGGYGPLRRILGDRATSPGDSLGNPLSNILSLYTARDGTVWAGRLNAGLFAFAPDGTFRRRLGASDGLGSEDVRFITEDSAGTLWVGTTGGFGRRPPGGHFEWFTAADGLPSDHVRVIRPEADGTVWVGTYGGGLARLREGRFGVVRMADGLSDDVVSSLLEDDSGNFWMSGNRGVFRVGRARLEAFLDGRAARVHSVLYGRADGMVNVETNGGFQPAAWRSRDGRLWFPTLRGVAVFDPGRPGIDGPAPPAAIESLLVDGVERSAEDGLRIGPGRPSVEIRYTGLGLAAPEHIVFRYRLGGYEDAWTEAGTRRVAYYPRLPPGRYRFEVAAANRDGALGRPAAMGLYAAPALHETLWFRGALGLLLVAGLAGAAQRRVTVARRAHAAEQAFSRALLESQESERKRIARELHDGLGQDLLLVKNYAALALSSGSDGAGREHVEKIGELTTGALRSVRALAHTLTPRQLDHVGITQALADVLRTVEEASKLRVTLALDDIDDAFDLESRIHIFRIVQEAVNNVLKHAEAGEVEVRVSRSAHSVEVLIQDDGRGFDARRLAASGRAGLGLDGIRQRVSMLSGTLAVESFPGGGTRLVASLPLASAPRTADAMPARLPQEAT